jgi:hypothetical protein
MSLEEARRLWADHLAAPFPDRLRGEEIDGVDMVMLDADVAGHISSWVGWPSGLEWLGTGSGGALEEARRNDLARRLDHLDRVVPLFKDAVEIRYFERLRALAALALESR